MTPTIWFDCDGVLADLVGGWLCVANRITGRRATHADVTSWEFSKCIVSAEEEVKVWLQIDSAPGFCRGLSMIDAAALGVLLRVRQLGYPVGCLTSPHLGPYWVPERVEWLKELGFTKREVVFASDKNHVPGLVLVEDNRDNAEQWLKAWPGSTAILIDRPWNQGPTPATRVRTWDDVEWCIRAAVARAGA